MSGSKSVHESISSKTGHSHQTQPVRPATWQCGGQASGPTEHRPSVRQFTSPAQGAHRRAARDERAFHPSLRLAYAFQKLNNQPADLLRLLLLKPVPRSINEMSTAHLRAGSTLHPLECAGSLENAPVALPADEQ